MFIHSSSHIDLLDKSKKVELVNTEVTPEVQFFRPVSDFSKYVNNCRSLNLSGILFINCYKKYARKSLHPVIKTKLNASAQTVTEKRTHCFHTITALTDYISRQRFVLIKRNLCGLRIVLAQTYVCVCTRVVDAGEHIYTVLPTHGELVFMIDLYKIQCLQLICLGFKQFLKISTLITL